MKTVKRETYINKVKPFINKQLIKVFTGQRRVGKSYLLFQIMEIIKQENSKNNIIYIDKENIDFDFIKNYHDLYDFVKSKSNSKYNFLFIDEVQEIFEFQKALRSLLAEGIYDIYCTGSNAYTLSSDLATLLSGRFIEIRVYGLSFNEFKLFYNADNSIETLNRYLKYGGLPYLVNLPNEEKIIFEYLKNVYNTIFFKDIVSRFQINNVPFLTDLTKFIAENIGNLFSSRKISEYLKSQQIKASTDLVINYLNYLENAFFIHRVKRTDVEGKKHFEIGEKIFFDDLGLRNSIIGYRTKDIAKIMENVVFLHLKINDFEVSVGQNKQNEIDFIGEKNNEKIYIQVCYQFNSQDTIDREFNNLLSINNNYRKIVVSMENLLSGNTFKGIEQINLLNFLNEDF